MLMLRIRVVLCGSTRFVASGAPLEELMLLRLTNLAVKWQRAAMMSVTALSNLPDFGQTKRTLRFM